MKGKHSIGGWVVVGLILLMGALISQLPSDSSALDESALSAEPGGKRALYLALSELGFPARIWTDRPSELPRGEGLLWLSAVPKYPDGVADLVDLESTPAQAQTAISPHDPAHYRRFMDEGGTILCALSADGMTEFLANELEIAIPLEGFEAEGHRGKASLHFIPTDEALECSKIRGLDPEYADSIPGGIVDGLLVSSSVHAPSELRDESEESAARLAEGVPGLIRIPVGRGSLVLMVSDRAFTNEYLRVADHGRMAVRLAEEYARGKPILFDEYALGRWSPGSWTTMATSNRLILLSIHLVLTLALLSWSLAWVRAFPRDAKPAEPLSALARVRSRASLFLRGGRPSLLAHQLRSGTLRALYVREKLRRRANEEGYEGEIEELLGGTAEPEEARSWVDRLAVRDEMSRDELVEFKEKLEGFSRRIQTGRVHASPEKGIM